MNNERESSGPLRLQAHVDECLECRDQPPPIERIATALNRGEAPIDVLTVSARTLARLQPELARLATRAFWRRVAAVLLPALAPLPLVLAYDAYVLRLVYGLVSSLLPEAVAAYLVLSYAALLVLIFAATYAAIPLLVAPLASRPLAQE